MAVKIMYTKNTQTVTVTLTDTTKTLLSGATVTGNLVDGNGSDVSNATDFALSELDNVGSPGVYTAIISALFNPPVAANYTLQVTAVKGDSQFYGEASLSVQIRVVT